MNAARGIRKEQQSQFVGFPPFFFLLNLKEYWVPGNFKLHLVLTKSKLVKSEWFDFLGENPTWGKSFCETLIDLLRAKVRTQHRQRGLFPELLFFSEAAVRYTFHIILVCFNVRDYRKQVFLGKSIISCLSVPRTMTHFFFPNRTIYRKERNQLADVC